MSSEKQILENQDEVEKAELKDVDIRDEKIENDDVGLQTLNVSQSVVPEDQQKWEFFQPPNIFGVDFPGENGVPVIMPAGGLPSDLKQIYDKGWSDNQFNQYVSDSISVNRTLRDIRSAYCKKVVENCRKNLPTTSVIIIFHNEAWSTLLRSVHSVLNRSPEHLIAEVILVDDFSDRGKWSSWNFTTF